MDTVVTFQGKALAAVLAITNRQAFPKARIRYGFWASESLSPSGQPKLAQIGFSHKLT
jgi:hypothetical protein